MRTVQRIEGRICPKCGDNSSQIYSGLNRTGSQRCQCKVCKCRYTLNPKQHAYPEEVRLLAVKEYFAGGSGRSVGKIHNFNHQNVLRWIRKTAKKNQRNLD